MTRETDPVERRQLTICRTEREIFDRCLGRMPAVTIPAAMLAGPEKPRAPTPAKAAPVQTPQDEAASIDWAGLGNDLERAVEKTDADRAATLIHGAIESGDSETLV